MIWQYIHDSMHFPLNQLFGRKYWYVCQECLIFFLHIMYLVIISFYDNLYSWVLLSLLTRLIWTEWIERIVKINAFKDRDKTTYCFWHPIRRQLSNSWRFTKMPWRPLPFNLSISSLRWNKNSFFSFYFLLSFLFLFFFKSS
jgi:hypothetical protein